MVDIATQFSEHSLSQFIQNKEINAVHIAFGSQDFLSIYGAARTGQSVHAIITLLLSHIAKSPQSNVFLHTQQHRLRPMYRVQMKEDIMEVQSVARTMGQEDIMLHGVQPSHVHYIHSIESHSCVCNFDYREYHDVFLKSVDIYVYTFQKLYDLNVMRIVH